MDCVCFELVMDGWGEDKRGRINSGGKESGDVGLEPSGLSAIFFIPRIKQYNFRTREFFWREINEIIMSSGG